MSNQTEQMIAQILPHPGKPMDVARKLADQYPEPLAWWQGGYYAHNGHQYVPVPTSEVIGWLQRATERALYEDTDSKGGATKRPWAPTRKKISDVEFTLSHGVLQRTGEEARGTFLRNGMFDYGEFSLVPHSPERFNLVCLPYDYEPAAEPRRWIEFLESSLPGDHSGHAFLQEWFGYVLSGRTDHQMMACLTGASRSGKGVIVRVLEAMIGRDNVTGFSLPQFTDQFGQSALIGKSLATISEPNFASRGASEAVEPLLRITGNDTVQVDRKHKDPWIGRLSTRFMILANQTPRLSNRSGALANRMTHLRFGVSFAGREDIGLDARLLSELPGIFNWSLMGLKRLDAQGRFTVPESHRAIDEKFREYADPDAEFIERYCTDGPEDTAYEADVHAAYRYWCSEKQRTKDGTDVTTLRHRLTDRAGVTSKRIGKAKRWHLVGLGLNEAGKLAALPPHQRPRGWDVVAEE